MALPGYFDDEYESLTSNLAAVPVPPPGTPFYAYDGTPVGRSLSCDPITMEPMLHGLDGLEGGLPRIAVGESFALPLVLGMAAYGGGGLVRGLLWALGAYYAPLPAAVLWASGLSVSYNRG